MGQYGNQPDFGTIVSKLADTPQPFPPSAIYVGETLDNDGTATLTLQIVGNDSLVTITGISSGAILPFIATEITAFSGVDNDNVFLYR